ncbi:hypothetical protein BY996DRAFT_8550582 [Phakopsora pachyrhizi]|nr:hypothetical protein BY996DRAFT_8550582 [Phakopsora pachyrhizi]
MTLFVMISVTRGIGNIGSGVISSMLLQFLFEAPRKTGFQINNILNNEPYHSISGNATQNLSAGDVGLVLSKLNIGIEEITKRLRSEVSTHHLELLSKASSIASLHDSLQSTKIGLKQIKTNVERLQRRLAPNILCWRCLLTTWIGTKMQPTYVEGWLGLSACQGGLKVKWQNWC